MFVKLEEVYDMNGRPWVPMIMNTNHIIRITQAEIGRQKVYVIVQTNQDGAVIVKPNTKTAEALFKMIPWKLTVHSLPSIIS